jgi:hypothetical protein
MYLQHVMRQSLLQDITEEFKQRPELQDSTHYEFAIQLLNQHIQEVTFDRGTPSPLKPLEPDKCHARAWSQHRGCQCKRKKDMGDYCKIHYTKIETEGYWKLGRYDEERPTHWPEGKKILWYDDPPFVAIDIVLCHQLYNLHKLISRKGR